MSDADADADADAFSYTDGGEAVGRGGGGGGGGESDDDDSNGSGDGAAPFDAAGLRSEEAARALRAAELAGGGPPARASRYFDPEAAEEDTDLESIPPGRKRPRGAAAAAAPTAPAPPAKRRPLQRGAKIGDRGHAEEALAVAGAQPPAPEQPQPLSGNQLLRQFGGAAQCALCLSSFGPALDPEKNPTLFVVYQIFEREKATLTEEMLAREIADGYEHVVRQPLLQDGVERPPPSWTPDMVLAHLRHHLVHREWKIIMAVHRLEALENSTLNDCVVVSPDTGQTRTNLSAVRTYQGLGKSKAQLLAERDRMVGKG
jgi:hypothetical protein